RQDRAPSQRVVHASRNFSRAHDGNLKENTMIALTEQDQPTGGEKMRMLEQMADALEDEIAGLFRRAAALEEEEFVLSHEVGERQTEINRLLLRLESMRAERERVMEKIESISREARAIREEAFNTEDRSRPSKSMA